MDAVFIDYSYEEIGKTDKKSPLHLKQEKKGNHQLKNVCLVALENNTNFFTNYKF